MQAFRPETLLKSGSNTSVFLWMLWFFLRTAFSIEHHWWLLLIKSDEKMFKWKKKMKIFHLNYTCNYVNIRTDRPFSLTFSLNFLLIPACSLFVFSFLTNWKISLFAFISISRSRHWELFCQTAVPQDRTKIANFFYKTGVSFKCSLLNKKVHKYTKSEILCRYSSRVMVIKPILQCNWTTTFLSQLWMAASDHLFN